ncbi:MAG: hypothetical protein Q8M16_05140 [Pirellulaceae bacterium]|nr:hypothetical protein [Pirellulaceae bacterium]
MLITIRQIFWTCGLLVQIMGIHTSRAPDPMPDGHINRDIQVLVEDREMNVEIRMAATDLTWIEIIRLAESRTNTQALQESGASAFYSESPAENSLIQPIPTDAAEITSWLQHDPNRQLLEKWLASHCRAEWCSVALPPVEKVESRSDGRHHLAVTFQLKYQIVPGLDAGLLNWHQTPFADYPGKVRRAIKTRGESMIDSTDVSPLVVRAEFELKTEEQAPTERAESIGAELRLPTE